MRMAASRVVLGLCALALAGCSGEDGVDRLRFAESSRTPGPEQVYLEDELILGESITLSVRVRDTADVASADLRLVYDPALVVYRAFGNGSLLEEGGSDVAYQVFEEQPDVDRVRAESVPNAGLAEHIDLAVLLRSAGLFPTVFLQKLFGSRGDL